MDKLEAFRLDDQLCFSLYAASRSISRMYRPLLDELGLTYPQYLVLLVLWEKKESTIKQLGEQLDLDTDTLTLHPRGAVCIQRAFGDGDGQSEQANQGTDEAQQ